MTHAFWKNRSVFITGHTGFKGSWLTMWLSRLGARVSGLSLSPETNPSLFDLASHSIGTTTIGDIRDLRVLRRAMETAAPDIVFHLAAQALVRRSYEDPVGTYATNVMGTVNVLEVIRHTPSVKAAVIVTSDKCYENRSQPWGYREDEPVGGHDPYSSSKACCELVTAAYRASFLNESMNCCAIATARAGNVIGGGDWSADRLVPDIVRARESGRAVVIRAPDAVRPWQHVLEPLNGYLKLAEALRSNVGYQYAEAWNFGPHDLDCVPVRVVVDRFASLWNMVWETSHAFHHHEAHILKVDAAKARARLKWLPKLSIHEAIDLTATWYEAVRADESPSSVVIEQIERYEQAMTSHKTE